MADITIPQLNAATSVSGTDVMVISQAGVTKKVEVDKITEKVLSSSVDILHMNPTTVQTLANIGELAFNPDTQTLEVKCSADVTLSIGQENYIRGKNSEADTVLNGTVVYVSGGQGANSLIKRASNNNTTGERVIGVATQNIGPNNIGFVTTNGIVNEINTSAFAEGDVLWLGVDGALTNVKPGTDVNQICIGVVLRSHATQGSLLVSVKDDWRGQVAQLRSDLSEIEQEQIQGGVYDVSAHNDGAVFESISALLSSSNLSTLIPISVRHGGMSIRFIQSSDNKYVQYRCVANEFTTDTTQWAIDDDGVNVENLEFDYIVLDDNKKIFFGIKKDGDFFFGSGCPMQVQEFVLTHKQEIIDMLEQEIIDMLATKVDKEEGKSLIQSDIAERTFMIDSPEFLNVVLDEGGHFLEGIEKKTGKHKYVTQELLDIEEDAKYLLKLTDYKGNIIFGVDKSLRLISKVSEQTKELIEERIDKNNKFPFIINKDQERNIYAAAHYNAWKDDEKKRLQLMLISDSHGVDNMVERAVSVANHLPTIDAFIHLGDMVPWTPNDTYNGRPDEIGYIVNNILNKCLKKYYIVCGNHEVGASKYIYYTLTHEEVYYKLVRPMIDLGYLVDGEYNTTGSYNDWCYYYHDFHKRKVRMIVLYNYDMELALEDNEYWEPVPYNASNAKMVPGTTYTYDANNSIILNCGGWKENSFQLKKTVTLTDNPEANQESGVWPWYKCRQYLVFGKNQMEWLINTLNSTPDGYGIVIASHQACNFPVTTTDYKFSIGSDPDNDYTPRNTGSDGETFIDTPIVGEIVNAWRTKSVLNARVAAKTSSLNHQSASYLNTLSDGQGDYMYKIQHDFSNRTNDNAHFLNFLCGHEHCDIIEKSVDYQKQLTIITTTSSNSHRYKSDMPSIIDEGSSAYDCLTIYSTSGSKIYLNKYGNSRSVAGVDRSWEEIDINNI